MAPSQNQDMANLQYTHKKFNCGYSHKKLGMCLIRRNSQEEELKQKDSITTNNTFKTSIFRPYELDNQENQKKSPQPQNPQVPETYPSSTTYTPQLSPYTPLYALQLTAQQSQEEYALKLQRQRAALYMKHVMQFYEHGNGWPSVHPNAINNPHFVQNF